MKSTSTHNLQNATLHMLCTQPDVSNIAETYFYSRDMIPYIDLETSYNDWFI